MIQRAGGKPTDQKVRNFNPHRGHLAQMFQNTLPCDENEGELGRNTRSGFSDAPIWKSENLGQSEYHNTERQSWIKHTDPNK